MSKISVRNGYEGAKGTASEAREYLATLTTPAPAVSTEKPLGDSE